MLGFTDDEDAVSADAGGRRNEEDLLNFLLEGLLGSSSSPVHGSR